MDNLITDQPMGDALFITGKQDGPLERACQQVFGWTREQELIVVVWHPSWRDDEEFWRRIAQRMHKQNSRASTLVVHFGGSLEEMKNGDGGDRLPLLFRLLGRDPQSRQGCCPITDFQHLGEASIDFNPDDSETSLILEGNRIMELFPPRE